MRSEYLISFIDELSSPPDDIGQLLKSENSHIRYKGYGTPELEMKFLHKIFLHIQKSHPEFESFSWQQYNGYNDVYHHFQLSSFTVNNKLNVNSDMDFYFEYYEEDKITSSISFDHVDYPDPEEIEYAKNNNFKFNENGLSQPHLDAYWEYRKKKYSYLEIPCLKFITFLKLLEINFSMYYFLYTFGNGIEAKFDKDGITVTNFDIKEMDGDSLGIGMDLDNL